MVLAQGWTQRKAVLWYLLLIPMTFIVTWGIPIGAFMGISSLPPLLSDPVLDLTVKITPIAAVWAGATLWIASIIDTPHYGWAGNENISGLSHK